MNRFRPLAAAALLLFTTAASADDAAAYLYILGVAQDAGYPQAGCYQPHCLPGWRVPTLRRTATSIALVDPAGGSKLLFEATPHLPEQLYRLELEAPSESFSFDGVFLTHAHMGHYAGLMHFGHEAMGASKVPVYAMPRMREYLRSNGPWSQLVEFENIALRALEDGATVSLGGATITPFLVPHRDEYSETVGYRIEGPERTAVFIPDIDKWEDWSTDLAELVRSVDFALIDATFYADGELPERDMSQVRHPYVVESMDRLQSLDATDREKVWFIHINHTNPLLDADSAESRSVRSRGYNVAREGLRLPL